MSQSRILQVLVTLILTAFISVCPAQESQAFVFEDRITTAKSLAYYTMGTMYDLLGETELAVLEYEKAVQFDEASYLIHLRLGADYARLNMLEEAKFQLDLVKKYNSDELQSHYLLALIYSTEKNYDKAAEEYEYILKKFSNAEPQNLEIYGYLGQLYYSQRKFDQAVEQFEKMIVLDPNNSDVMYLLGSLYLEVNKRAQAVEILQKSIEADPDHDGSLNTLGYIYAENNEKLDEATELINRALALSPDNGAYLDSLGWVYYQKGVYDKALDVLVKADSLLVDPVIKEHLGDVYYKLNRVDEAVENWELSLKLLPAQEKIIQKINQIKNSQASR